MPTISEEQIASLVKLQKIVTEVQKLQVSLKEMPARLGILDEQLEEVYAQC